MFSFMDRDMVITMKLTSFVCNLYDGTYDKKKVFAKHEGKNSSIMNDRKKYAIESLPNPLEFFGYMYCFTCILAGPAFEYKEYISTFNGDMFKLKNGSTIRPPGRVVKSLKCFVIGMVWMIINMVGSAYVPLDKVYNINYVTGTMDPLAMIYRETLTLTLTRTMDPLAMIYR